ncbi:MAG: hypothetical protein ACREEN_04230, partial [Stellaceae bacterium]
TEDERRRYQAAVAASDFTTAVIFAGEAVDLIGDAPPAATIVARLAEEAERALRAAARHLA